MRSATLKPLHVAGLLAQAARHFLDDLIARIGHRVHRMAEADDHFLVADARADVRRRFIRRLIAALDVERDFVRATVLRPAQRADGAGDARVHVRPRARDHARRERRRVELMLRVKDERRMHRAHPRLRRLPTMQQMQEVPADRIIFRLDVNRLPGMAVVIPVRQHRAERRDEPIRDVARAGGVVIVLLRQRAAERRHARAHHIHRMRGRRQRFERRAHHRRQAAQALQLRLVRRELGAIRQLARESADARSLRTRTWSAISRMS